MTEAAILTLIAFAGLLAFGIMSIILTKTVLKNLPTHISFSTAYGKFEADFDKKAGGQ